METNWEQAILILPLLDSKVYKYHNLPIQFVHGKRNRSNLLSRCTTSLPGLQTFRKACAVEVAQDAKDEVRLTQRID